MKHFTFFSRVGLQLHVAACLLCAARAATADYPAATNLPPVLVGGHAHGAENIHALADLGLGNFVWIPKQGYALGNMPWNEEHNILADARTCAERGLYFMISQRRGLGPLAKTPELLETLKAYVHNGGVLHLNVNQMRNREAFVQAPEFLGTEIGMSRVWSEWSHSNLLMRGLARADVTVCRQAIGPWPAGSRFDEPPYLAQDVQPTTARGPGR